MKCRYKDIAGMRFGSLTAIRYVGSDAKGHAQWLCKCDCGNEKVVLSGKLLSGHTTACGHKGHKVRTYCPGRDNPRLYEVWKGMKARCHNSNNKCYYLYGAKGISVCNEWQDFKAFARWALENGYQENAPYGECTLDRIDSAKNYSPDNCRWVNSTVQARNKSNNVLLTYNGKTQLATDWSKELQIPLSTISVRLKRGWSVEKALSQDRWIRGDCPS